MWEISWLVEELLMSQEGMFSEFASYVVSHLIIKVSNITNPSVY